MVVVRTTYEKREAKGDWLAFCFPPLSLWTSQQHHAQYSNPRASDRKRHAGLGLPSSAHTRCGAVARGWRGISRSKNGDGNIRGFTALVLMSTHNERTTLMSTHESPTGHGSIQTIPASAAWDNKQVDLAVSSSDKESAAFRGEVCVFYRATDLN